MTPTEQLTKIVTLGRQAMTAWEQMADLRRSLLQQITDPDIDTSELDGYVSVTNRKAKLEVPEIVALRQAIDDAQQKLYASRQEQIYAAQCAVQEAEEQLAQALTTPEIKRMQDELAILEHQHSNSQPELTKGLVVRKSANALLDSTISQ